MIVKRHEFLESLKACLSKHDLKSGNIPIKITKMLPCFVSYHIELIA